MPKRQTVPNTGQGVNYQIQKLMQVAFVSAYVNNLDFELLTEDTTYGDFDDVVLRIDTKTVVMQLKHRINQDQSVSLGDLVTEKGNGKELVLYKYFDSVFSQLQLTTEHTDFVLVSNEPLTEELSECIDPITLKFKEDFYKGNTPALLFIRNSIIASLCKYSEKINTRIQDAIDIRKIVIFLINFIQTDFCTKTLKDDLLKFIRDNSKIKRIPSAKHTEVIIEYLEKISQEGLNNENTQSLIKILKDNALYQGSKFTVYDAAIIDDISKYPEVFIFLQKLKFNFGDVNVTQLENEMQAKLREQFNTNNDAIYHAFFHKFYLWLISPEAISLTNNNIKELFRKWRNQYIHLEQLCGMTKQKLSWVNPKIAEDKTFSHEQELSLLSNFIDQQQDSLLFLHGEAGIGKSSLIKLLFNNRKPVDGKWIFMNIRDYLSFINQTQQQFNLDTLRSLNVIFLDCAELIMNNQQLKDMVIRLNSDCQKAGKKLVLLLRTEASVTLKQLMGNSVEICVDGLNLEEIIHEYPFLQSASQTTDGIRHLLTTPFYLNLIVKFHVEFQPIALNKNNTIEDIKDRLIQMSVENPAKSQTDSSFERSMQAFENPERKLVLLKKVAFNSLNMSETIFTLEQHWHNVAESLVTSGIFLRIELGQYIFSHDIYYEWAVSQLIMQEFNVRLEIQNSFEEFLNIPYSYHLCLWFKKNLTLMIPYLHNLVSYKISDRGLNILIELIYHVINTTLSHEQRSALGSALSFLWQCYRGDRRFNQDIAKRIFNYLLLVTEFIDKKIIKSIEEIPPNQYQPRNTFYNYYRLEYRSEWEDIMIQAILKSKRADSFCQYYPKQVIALINKTCFLPDLESSSEFCRGDEHFGLVEDKQDGWYSSAYFGPFFSLLHHHGNKYLGEIIDIINKACLKYVDISKRNPDQSSMYDSDKPIIEIDFVKNNGTTLKLYGNTYLWSLYRSNNYNCFMPGLIQSALMAIELWLFNIFDDASAEQKELFENLNIIINNSKTVATISIIASLCMRYRSILTEYALLLFRVKEFYTWDYERKFHEDLPHNHRFLIHCENASIFCEEREKSDSLPHRKRDLTELTLIMQSENSNLCNFIQKLLDEQYEQLPPLELQQKEDKLLKIALFKRDLRKQRKEVLQSTPPGRLISLTTEFDNDLKEFLAGSENRDTNQFNQISKLLNYTKQLYEGSEVIPADKIQELISSSDQLNDEIQEKFKKNMAQAAQCYLACALLKHDYDSLSQENRQWCYDIITNKILAKCNNRASTQLLGLNDGKIPIAEFFPELMARFSYDHPDFEKVKKIVIICLTHFSNHVKTLTCKAINIHLWTVHTNFVNQCMIALIELARIEALSYWDRSDDDRIKKISTLKDNLFYEQLKTITSPELFVIPVGDENKSMLGSPFNLNMLFALMLLLNSGNLDDTLSSILLKSYLYTLIHDFNLAYFDLVEFRVCELSWFFLQDLVGRFLLISSFEDVKNYLELVQGQNNYELMAWILDGIFRIASTEEINTQSFWDIWNYTLRLLNENNVNVHTITEVIFKPFLNYLIFHPFSTESFQKRFYDFIFSRNEFILKNSANDFAAFLLSTESLVIDDDIFGQWLALAKHIQFDCLLKIFKIIKEKSETIALQNVQEAMKDFLLILSLKYLEFISKDKILCEMFVDFLKLLGDSVFTSKLKDDLLKIQRNQSVITNDSRISTKRKDSDADKDNKRTKITAISLGDTSRKSPHFFPTPLPQTDSQSAKKSKKGMDNHENKDDIPESVYFESMKMAVDQGRIGPREIPGWVLQDVDDHGNCFYDAVIHQLSLIDHIFLNQVPTGTKPRDSLRLRIQGEEFKDQEWADDRVFDRFVREFNVILAVVDTRNSVAGFVCYYQGEDGDIITNAHGEMVLPNKPILRLAATGNHFLSVISNPDLLNGAIHNHFNVSASSQQSMSWH